MSVNKVGVVNKKYNRLTALYPTGNKTNCGKLKWLFKCDCGNEHEVAMTLVIRNKVKSCGCLALETSMKNKPSPTHGHMGGNTPSPTYISWQAMKRRAGKGSYYKSIDLCDRWMEFANFLEDMRERPEGTSIDRIDNNKGYNKKNCRWATKKQQNNNKSSNIRLEYKGATKSLKEWCDKFGVRYSKVYDRIKFLKWSFEEAFNIKKRINKN